MTETILQSIDEFDVTGSCNGTKQDDDHTTTGAGNGHDERQTDSTHVINVDASLASDCPEKEKELPAEKWKRRRIVSLYLVTISILFADMNLMAPNLSTSEHFILNDFPFRSNLCFSIIYMLDAAYFFLNSIT